MNTTKSVYNRLFAEDKVELASERVELGVVDDIASSTAKANKIESDIFALVKEADTATAQLQKIQDILTKKHCHN